MIEETAVVSKIIANQVWVQGTGRPSSCGKCVQNSSCSTHLLEKYIAKREIPVDTELSLECGDKIVVAIDEGQLIKGSLLIYILPLLALFLGALLGDYASHVWSAFNSDLIVSISAVVCFFSVLWVLNKWPFSLLVQQFARPIVVRKL